MFTIHKDGKTYDSISKAGIPFCPSLHGMLYNCGAKHFLAVQKPDGAYTLSPVFDETKLEEKKGLKYISPFTKRQGTYGTVKLYPTEQMAVKYSKSDINNGIPDDIIRELAVYRALIPTANYIPKLYGFVLETPVSLAFDLGKSTLTSTVMEAMSKEKRTLTMFQLLGEMRAAATMGIMHCDLKPENIVLNRDGGIQIIDWGMTVIDSSKGQRLDKQPWIQTRWWTAPEILEAQIKQKNITFTNKVDIFSLGIIFFQMLTDKLIATQDKQEAQYARLFGNLLGSYYTKKYNTDNTKRFDHIIRERLLTSSFAKTWTGQPMTEEQADLLSHMLEPNPQYRWSYDQLYIHPIFQHIRRERIPRAKFGDEFLVADIEKFWFSEATEDNTSFKIRAILFQWMAEIAAKISSVRALCLAYHLVDMYKTLNICIPRSQLQLLGCGALLLASKIYDNYVIQIRDLIYYSANTYKDSEIQEMERNIVKAFDGNLFVPTIYDFQNHYFGSIAKETFELKKERAMYYYKLYATNDVYSGKYYGKVQLPSEASLPIIYEHKNEK